MACLINAKSTGVGGIDASGDASGVLALQTGGTTAVTIDASQNVGIGTIPNGGFLTGNKFEINAGALGTTAGNISAATILNANDGNSTVLQTYNYRVSNGSSHVTSEWRQQRIVDITRMGYTGYGSNYISFGQNTTEQMRIDSSGNVGIGTTSPSTYGRLVVSGTSNADAGIFIGNLSLTGSAPTYRGTVRIIDNPSSSTGTSGGLEFLTSTYGSGYGWKIAAIDSSGVPLTFSTRQNSASWTEAMRIDSSGNVLVGYTTSNGSYKLQVNSQIFATSTTIATSDANYKTNVIPLTGALALVNNLNPVSFSWKPHLVHDFDVNTPTLGFLAQEVQAVLANESYVNSVVKKSTCTITSEIKDEKGNITTPAVTEDFLGIAEGNMISILTKAIQELKAIIDTQQTRITALEAK